MLDLTLLALNGLDRHTLLVGPPESGVVEAAGGSDYLERKSVLCVLSGEGSLLGGGAEKLPFLLGISTGLPD